jgi:L-rhamnose mutarotase
MKIKSRALGALAGLFVFATMAVSAQAADRPYTEGSVLNVAAIRTEPGMFEEYMKYLAGPYKQLMEEQKKAGIILGYNIYVANPRSPDEPDLYLVTIYKDMAALDGMNAKTDPITEKLYGGMDQQTTSTVQRGKLRTLIGDELIRELVLK